MKNYALRRTLGAALLACAILLSIAATARAGEALYFSFLSGPTLPASPSSLLVQSPSFIDVPAGAVLTVHLLRGESLVATSRLTFQQAFQNPSLVPAVPIASYVPLGSSNNAGQPLPGATLTAGQADLTKVAMDPSQYRLLWVLTTGQMGTPGRAVVTGASAAFVDLKLSAVSAAAAIGDQKPGSVLFFNRYTSSPTNALREDTTLNLTNTNPTAGGFVRLFLVNGATCQVQEVKVCLAARQTISIKMSDLDPGVKGYLVAVATNQAGEPTQFNWLTGNVVVKQPTGVGSFSGQLNAIAIAKRKAGDLKAGANNEAEMVFDDDTYDRLPAQNAIEGVPTQTSNANQTTISLYRPVANLNTGTGAATTVQLNAWNRDVATSSGSVAVACYSDFTVGSLRLQPISIATLIPAGTTAWFSAGSADLQPVLGAQFNVGEFSSGINLRPLNFTADYRIKIPISAVTCQ